LVAALTKYKGNWVMEKGFIKEKVPKEEAVAQAEKLITELPL